MTTAATNTARSAAPCPSQPAGDGAVVCASCGQINTVGENQCARPTCRKTLRGNGLSRTTGFRVTNLTPELRAIEAAGQVLASQSIVDAGGREELIAREVADHEYRGLLHVNILKLARALDAHGHFDRRGRLRVGWITKLESLISTAVGIDKLLGLQRRQKRAPSLAEYLESRAEAAPTVDPEAQ